MAISNLLRITMPFLLCAAFIGEGLFAGWLCSDSGGDTAPLPSQILLAPRTRDPDWPLSHMTEEVSKALPWNSPVASAARMEADPDPAEHLIRSTISAKFSHSISNKAAFAESGFAADSTSDSISGQPPLPLRWNWASGQCEARPRISLILEAAFAAAPEPTDGTNMETLQNRVARYRVAVDTWSRNFGLKPDLVYAIIDTESDFNPKLISSRYAHGLMQIVPETAGGEVKRWLGGKGEPSPSELLDPYTNIKYGTGYFRLLLQRHFGPINDAVSREYCAIAAYNSGSGPVLKIFGNTRNEAFEAINQLNADEVLNMLLDRMPISETRSFLRNVLNARQKFTVLTAASTGWDPAVHAIAQTGR